MGLEADKALLGQGLVVFAHIHAHTTVMKSFLAFKIMIHCRYTYVSSFAAVIKNKIRFKKKIKYLNLPAYQQLTAVLSTKQ